MGTQKIIKTGLNHDINNYEGNFKDQRWLVAHNGWNTGQSTPNQVRSITQLLNYGVRGFALDIYEDDGKLILRHVHYSGTKKSWNDILYEIKTWMDENPREVVCLFFESHLPGPNGKGGANPLEWLHLSLTHGGMPYYKGGKQAQTAALIGTSGTPAPLLKDLVTLEVDEHNVSKSHRLFAFIQNVPDEGPQDYFPEMTEIFAENKYGNTSLNKSTWTNLRDDSNSPSNYANPLTFLNHFGDNASGSEWSRNWIGLLREHIEAFVFSYQGRYPNFISLDVINWHKDYDDADGPVKLAKQLKYRPDVSVTKFHWLDRNGVEYYDIELPTIGDRPIVSLSVEIGEGQGITKIHHQRGNGHGIDKVQVYNHGKWGIVNLRYHEIGSGWSKWLTDFEKPEKENDPHDENLATHEAKNGYLAGFACRAEDKHGIMDFAIAFRER